MSIRHGKRLAGWILLYSIIVIFFSSVATTAAEGVPQDLAETAAGGQRAAGPVPGKEVMKELDPPHRIPSKIQ